jgi:MFS family permease
MGASDGAIGVIMAAFAITSLLLRPITGWGADRFGRRPFMLAGSLLFALASVAYGWVAGALGLRCWASMAWPPASRSPWDPSAAWRS